MNAPQLTPSRSPNLVRSNRYDRGVSVVAIQLRLPAFFFLRRTQHFPLSLESFESYRTSRLTYPAHKNDDAFTRRRLVIVAGRPGLQSIAIENQTTR